MRTSASSPIRPTTPAVLDELRGRRVAVRRDPPPPGPHRLRPHRGLRRGVVDWFDRGDDDAAAADAARGRRSGSRCSCGTARTRTRPPPCTAPTAPTPGGPTPRSTAGSRSATSTSTTPMPPGCSCTTSPTPPAGRRSPIIKHANPCGAAVADTLADAYQRAFECDPRSAFGGIVALSDPVDEATVTRRWWPPPRPTSSIAPGLRRRHRRRARSASAGTPASSRPRRPRPTPATCARSPAAGWCRSRTASSPGRPTGTSSPSAIPTAERAGRRRAGLPDLRLGEVEQHRPGEGRRGLGHRRRAAEPGRGRPDRGGEGGRAGPRAVPVPATPSTRSPTASRRRPRPAWR